MLGFFGNYQHTVDPKGRVSLPAQFRKKEGLFGEDIIAVPAIEGNSINLYTPEGLEKWIDQIFGEEGFQANNPEHASWIERYLGNAASIDVDKNGRINIPQRMRDEYNLGDKVVFVGARDHVGLWNPEVWEEWMKDFDPRIIYKSPQQQ